MASPSERFTSTPHYHLRYYGVRKLSDDDESNFLSRLSSTEMILWYCLVAVILVPFAMCFLYYMYHNHRSHRRALQAANEEEDDDDVDMEAMGVERRHPQQNLELMEQNIEAFSKLEKLRITRIVRSSVRKHVKQFSPDERKRHTATASSEKETICSICLEDLIPSSGSNKKNAVCSSSNPHCRHLYHEDCIVSWLVPKAQWLCPICRQEFIVPKKRNSSSCTIAATDRCSSSSVCALSTTGAADQVSTMTTRSTASELGDVLPMSPGGGELFESSELQDIEEGHDDPSLPPSSSASTVQDDSSSSGSDGNNDAVEQHE